ncbi:kinase-like protein [Rozella allomycis CSF55]|uniref:non-specific serine/threonine protein kinase n=1 Tax=Rozella allomycis (strain CSF55) TaxID=988480 RepID=A0A4V1IZS0_ROZAC|nr:kinase-like protein [Rozella allomycis CSF55]
MQELKSSWVDIYIKYHRLLANFDNKVQYVALKTITPTSSPSKIKEELEFLILLRGKFFTSPVITAVRKEDQVIVVMPYFSHDSAMEYIPRMKEIDIKLYMAQLLFALSWLHTMNIIHRDVKPGNFLFSLSTRRGLLVDFGLAEYFDDSFQEEKETKSTIDAEIHRGLRETYGDGILPKDSRSQLKANRGGTRGFRAPEVLMRYKDQTPAIDLWAAGIVLLCLATKRFPFFQSNDDDDALVELAIVFGRKKVEKAAAICNRVWKCNVPGITDEGKFKTLKELCQSLNPYDEWSDDLYDLLDKLLDFDFNSRITSLDALQHKFINSQEVLEKLNKELLNF